MSRRLHLLCAVALASAMAAAPGFAAPASGRDDSPRAAPAGQRFAEQAKPYDRFAIPKPSDRRKGELEGWTEPKKEGKPAAVQGGKGKQSAKAAKPVAAGQAAKTRDPEDGGLPLPGSKTQDNSAPVGFDSKGNIGTGFKF
jgi:hypothetical protein